MKFYEILSVRVAEIKAVTPLVKRFTLVSNAGDNLPGFSAGSHVMVHVPGKDRIYHNAYSLMSAPRTRDYYQIGVLRQEQSRGGSVYMHEQVNVGDLLQITPPVNLFPLDRLARKHILIAGGIGITPFLSYLNELAELQVPYELHYTYRTRAQAAFLEQLTLQLGSIMHTYESGRNRRIRPRSMLANQPLGTHMYVCGSVSFTNAVIEGARELGWPDSHVHYEQFAAPHPGTSFKVICAKTACEIDVPEDMSLLEALESAGIAIPNACRGGVCGQCETEILEGEAEHRDSYLSDESRDCKITPCVSRAKTGLLVLNL